MSEASKETLVWTKDKPTVPGWYWYRARSCSRGTVLLTQRDIDMDGLRNGMDWAGPISEPQEPPKPLPLPRRGRCKWQGDDAVIVDFGTAAGLEEHFGSRRYAISDGRSLELLSHKRLVSGDSGVTDIEWVDDAE